MFGNLFEEKSDEKSYLNAAVEKALNAHYYLQAASLNYTRKWEDMSTEQRLWVSLWQQRYDVALGVIDDLGYKGVYNLVLLTTRNTALYINDVIIRGHNAAMEVIKADCDTAEGGAKKLRREAFTSLKEDEE